MRKIGKGTVSEKTTTSNFEKEFMSFTSAVDKSTSTNVLAVYYPVTGVLLNYAQDDQLIIDTYAVSCQTYATGQLAKFVIGQRDLSEWNQYLSELDTKYHLQEMKKAHETAYQAALKR